MKRIAERLATHAKPRVASEMKFEIHYIAIRFMGQNNEQSPSIIITDDKQLFTS